jgi:hypothetical protein
MTQAPVTFSGGAAEATDVIAAPMQAKTADQLRIVCGFMIDAPVRIEEQLPFMSTHRIAKRIRSGPFGRVTAGALNQSIQPIEQDRRSPLDRALNQ